jgi:hypothetical protein
MKKVSAKRGRRSDRRRRGHAGHRVARHRLDPTEVAAPASPYRDYQSTLWL